MTARRKPAPKPRAGRPAAKSRATARRTTPAGGKRPAKRAPARRDGRLRRAARGDRPYAVALFGLLVVIGAMALGPLQNYTAAADRVESLERTRDQLREEVDDLEEQRSRLHDPEEIETRARTQLNLVRPGEIPFVVVTPEDAEPRVGPEPPPEGSGADTPWYRRLGRWLAERAGAGR